MQPCRAGGFTWSYRAGAGWAESFPLNPLPLTAGVAHEFGVVGEAVADAKALGRTRWPASILNAPEVTRRNTRVHFIQP